MLFRILGRLPKCITHFNAHEREIFLNMKKYFLPVGRNEK